MSVGSYGIRPLIEFKFSKELFRLEKNILGISLYIFNVIFRGISYIFEKLIVIHIKLINFVKDCFVVVVVIVILVVFVVFVVIVIVILMVVVVVVIVNLVDVIVILVVVIVILVVVVVVVTLIVIVVLDFTR